MSEKRSLKDTVSVILGELNITDFDPGAVVSLCDFVCNYTTSVLTEAKNCARNQNNPTRDDIAFAVRYINDSSVFNDFCEIAKCAKMVNKEPLPHVSKKVRLNLPAESYRLNGCNYVLKRR